MLASPVASPFRTRFPALALAAALLLGARVGGASAGAEQDRDMLARLEKARFEKAEVKDGHGGAARADRAYAEAFRAYGIDVEKLEPAQAAARIKQQAIRVELAAALDEWAALKKEVQGRQRLLAVARAADPDPWRNRLRDALEKRDLKALQKLAGAADLKTLPAATVVVLGEALANSGGLAEAVTVLRQAQWQHPADFWINHQLGLYLLRLQPARSAEAVRFFTAAIALRPKSPSVYLNLGTALQRLGELEESVTAYRQAVRLRPDFAQAQARLGTALAAQGKLEEASAVFRNALSLDPKDSLVHRSLGLTLYAQRRLEEAIACYRTAIALDPRDARAHASLATALHAKGQLDEAIAAYRRALALQPDLAPAHLGLGDALRTKGRLDEALAAYRQAIRLQPDLAQAYVRLSAALAAQGKLSEAIATCRRAIELQPANSAAHRHLGHLLTHQHKLDEAIDAFRKAIALDPRDAQAYASLATALHDKGQLDEAIAVYRRALALQPDLAPAHLGLGDALRTKGRLDEALAAYRQAVRLQKDDPRAHYALGGVLAQKGLLREAVAAFREALRLRPAWAEAQCCLGHTLQRQGQFAEALDALRRGHELGMKNPRWPYPSAAWIKKAEQLIQLDARLPAVLNGSARPTNTAETLALAELCLQYRHRPAAAARLYAEAFAAAPRLSEDLKQGNRSNAACAAAQAAAGEGEDGARLDARERTRLRWQALAWLRADLALWAKLLDSKTPRARAEVERTLRHWQRDPDLASLREAARLARLPEAERKGCQSFWADVEGLLRRARSPK